MRCGCQRFLVAARCRFLDCVMHNHACAKQTEEAFNGSETGPMRLQSRHISGKAGKSLTWVVKTAERGHRVFGAPAA